LINSFEELKECGNNNLLILVSEIGFVTFEEINTFKKYLLPHKLDLNVIFLFE